MYGSVNGNSAVELREIKLEPELKSPPRSLRASRFQLSTHHEKCTLVPLRYPVRNRPEKQLERYDSLQSTEVAKRPNDDIGAGRLNCLLPDSAMSCRSRHRTVRRQLALRHGSEAVIAF
jgi:hypothetical protein